MKQLIAVVAAMARSASILPGLIDLPTHLTSTGVHWEDELVKTTRPGAARRADRAGDVERGLHNLPRHGADLALQRHLD